MVEPIYKRSAGLDVHKKMVMATILIEQADGSLKKETREFKAFPNDLAQLARWLKNNQIELSVMESTGVYWKSVYAALEELSLKVFVVNARHVKQVPGRKTDVKDSEWLASLARFGLLKPSFIPEKDLRELRIVTRHRNKLIGILAGEKNRLHKILDDAGVRLGNVVSDINGLSAKGIIQGLIDNEPMGKLLLHLHGKLRKKASEIKEALSGTLSERHRFTLKRIQSHIKYLEKELQEINDYLLKAMKPYEAQWKILQTIPGIDEMSAAVIIVEMGVDMQRFGNREQLCSWAGVCPGHNESAGKKKSAHTRKGNRQLRSSLCQISNAAIKTNSQFKGKYKGLVIRRGHKRAVVAVGHKILRVAYSLLKNNKPYQDPGIDYESMVINRNASRWMRSLEKFGFLPTSKVAIAK